MKILLDLITFLDVIKEMIINRIQYNFQFFFSFRISVKKNIVIIYIISTDSTNLCISEESSPISYDSVEDVHRRAYKTFCKQLGVMPCSKVLRQFGKTSVNLADLNLSNKELKAALMTFIVGSIRPLYVSSDSYTSYLTKIKLKKSILNGLFTEHFQR